MGRVVEERGSCVTECLVRHLKRNVRGMRSAVAELRLPTATSLSASRAGLSDEESRRAALVFERMDVDGRGSILKRDVVMMHGGDGEGMLRGVTDADTGADVSLDAWLLWLRGVKRTRGSEVLEFVLDHMDRCLDWLSLIHI